MIKGTLRSNNGDSFRKCHLKSELAFFQFSSWLFKLIYFVKYTYFNKVASEKNDAWSMFHSLRCIIVTSLVNYVPAMILET